MSKSHVNKSQVITSERRRLDGLTTFRLEGLWQKP